MDEYQDCSAAQTQLLAALAHHGCELMVFGDPEQAIYGFGGNGYTAGSRSLMARKSSLPQSHRLHAENAALATAVANTRTSKIVTQTPGHAARVGTQPRHHRSNAQSVVRDIQRLLG